MAKSDDPELEQIKNLLSQVNNKLVNAKVLNGGFDRMEQELHSVKQMQVKLNADFEAHKMNDERIEGKLDKLYDPEGGIYSKVQKTEAMLQNLTAKIDGLNVTDGEFKNRLGQIEDTAKIALLKTKDIEKITGKEHEDLLKSIRLSKFAWWFGGFAGVGLLSAVGKLLWDLFIG